MLTLLFALHSGDSEIMERTQDASWQALQEHHSKTASLHLRELFRDSPDRAAGMTLEACGLLGDRGAHREVPTLSRAS